MKHLRSISTSRPQPAVLVGGGGGGSAKTDLLLTIKAALVDFQFAKNNGVITGT